MYGDGHLSDRKQVWRLIATQPKVGFDDASTAFQDVRMKCNVDQIQSFIDGIHGRPMVAGSGFDGWAGVAACLALLESSKEGRIVQLIYKMEHLVEIAMVSCHVNSTVPTWLCPPADRAANSRQWRFFSR
jgi:hypothetical protein